MTIQWQVENPVHRSGARWVFDLLVAIGAGAAALPYLTRSGSGHPPVAAYIVLAVVVAPLVARRVYPLPVCAWVLVAAGLAGHWDHRIIAGLAVLIALYTVAALLPRRAGFLGGTVVTAAIIVVTIQTSGTGWWYDAIPVVGLVAAAIALGLYAATRRAYLRELHQRAERLEHERDQQGALAAAAERARIAREMHDIVAHHLTVMVTLSDAAIAATPTSPQRGIDAMREVSSTGRRALGETRRLLGVLREETTGLGGAQGSHPLPTLSDLPALIDQVRTAGLPTTLQMHGALAGISVGAQLAGYRLVQEALTNTLKHAGPGAHATVQLRRDGQLLRIAVVDDGGTGTSAVAANGVGRRLSGMRERIHAYGGDVHAGPRRTTGWQVNATLQSDEEPRTP